MREVRVFEKVYLCDMQGCDGEMRGTGRIFELMPGEASIEHRCMKCGAMKSMRRMAYPQMISIAKSAPIPPEFLALMDTPANDEKSPDS